MRRGDTCHNQDLAVVASAPGVTCVECNLNGYLSAGACVCYQTGLDATCYLQPSSPEAVTTGCALGFCEDQDDVCVQSEYGVGCASCGGLGYIVYDGSSMACSCYDAGSDPNALCALIVDTHTTLSFNQTKADLSCTWFQNRSLGYFASNEECGLPGTPMANVG